MANNKRSMNPIWTRLRKNGTRLSREMVHIAQLLASSSHGPLISCDLPIRGEYVVSSSAGLFRLTHNGYWRVSPLPAFGIALSRDSLFVASSANGCSYVYRGKSSALTKKKSFAWDELYSNNFQSDSDRIHQISAYEDVVWICNTAVNCLTKIDASTGQWLANIALFRDEFGETIWGNNNHINGVCAGPGYVAFTAFKGGRQGIFGLCGKGKILLFTFPNLGVHDCIPAKDMFWFSDSYRFWEPKQKGGIPFRGRNPVCADWFNANPVGFVRGLAGSGNEVIIGSSFVGEREKRFKGCGQLIIAIDGCIHSAVDLPAPQIYDVLRIDGRHFDDSPADNYEAVKKVMIHAFGAPKIVRSLHDSLVSERGRKYDVRDSGQIPELLA